MPKINEKGYPQKLMRISGNGIYLHANMILFIIFRQPVTIPVNSLFQSDKNGLTIFLS